MREPRPETEADIPAAEFLNYKRFLSLDLSYGHAVNSEMFRHLMTACPRQTMTSSCGHRPAPLGDEPIDALCNIGRVAQHSV